MESPPVGFIRSMSVRISERLLAGGGVSRTMGPDIALEGASFAENGLSDGLVLDFFRSFLFFLFFLLLELSLLLEEDELEELEE